VTIEMCTIPVYIFKHSYSNFLVSIPLDKKSVTIYNTLLFILVEDIQLCLKYNIKMK
jgi:hypothetical protein